MMWGRVEFTQKHPQAAGEADRSLRGVPENRDRAQVAKMAAAVKAKSFN